MVARTMAQKTVSRRQFLSGVAAGSVGLLLAGCAPKPAGQQGAAPTQAAGVQPAPAEKVTITHWQHHNEARAAIVKSLSEEFMQANPTVSVVFESVPYDAYFDKVVTSLEAGSGPDVYQIPANIAIEFYNRKQIIAVPDEVMSRADIEKEFVPWTVRLLKFQGDYYGLPTDVQVWPLYVNTDLASAAGLDIEKGPQTWDEFREWAKALTKRDSSGNLEQAGVDICASAYQYYYQMPAQLCQCLPVDDNYNVNYDSDWGIEAWQFVTDLVTKDGDDHPQFLADQQKFSLGKAAMRISEYVGIGDLKLAAPDLKFKVFATPHPASKPPSIMGSSWSYVVSSASKQIKAAWSWVQFLTSAESQKKWAAGGGECPSRVALLADEELRSNPNVAAAFDAFPTAIPMDGWGWDDVWTIRQAIWDRIVLQNADVAASVKQGAEEERALYKKKFGL